MKFLWIIFYALLFTSCQQIPVQQRAPSSIHDVLEGIPRIEQLVSAPNDFNQENCAEFLNHISNDLMERPGRFFYPTTPEEKILLGREAFPLGPRLENIRRQIRRHFVSFSAPSSACVSAVRQALRVTRFAEETMALWLQKNGYLPGFDSLWSGQKFRDIVNPDTSQPKVQAGDLLLMRGNSYASALIARIGQDEGHFSHLAIVGQSENGTLYVVEALIEKGVVITPFSEWEKKTELARLVVLRHKNKKLASAAAKAIYQEMSGRLKKEKEIIYDFAMNEKDHGKIFCSEVIYRAFELAGISSPLPAYPSSIAGLLGKKLLVDMGLKKSFVFDPSDIEIDPRFDIVREHRDLRKTRGVQIQDAVATQLLNWMRAGYDLQETSREETLADLAHGLRQIGLLNARMQKKMSPILIADILRLKKISDALADDAAAADGTSLRQNQRLLVYHELLSFLNDSRIQDCDDYNRRRSFLSGDRKFLHHYFRPAGENSRCSEIP